MGLSLAAWVGVAVALAALSLIVRTWNHEPAEPRQRGGKIYPGRRPVVPPIRPATDLFLMIEIDDSDRCWLWKGPIDHNGYGDATFDGTRMRAHRFFYTALSGPVPEGHVLHHECETKLCCNPGHLTAVMPAEHSRIHTRAQCRRGHSMEDAIDRADGSRQCRTCYNAAARQRRLRVSAAVRAHTLTPPHGTTQAYNIHGCRCDKCREAKRLSRRPAEAAA